MGWRVGDKQFLKTTGETDKEAAKKQLATFQRLEIAQKANALTEDFYRAATGKQIERTMAGAFFNAYLTDSEGVTTKSTMNKYRQVVREFLTHIEAESKAMLLDDITVDHVSGFLTAKRLRLSPGTIKGYRRILSSVFLRAQNEGKIKGNPVALAKGRGRTGSDAAAEKKPFTLKQLQALHSKATPFWKYMILGGYSTGQSLGDLATMRAETVDLDANQITMNRRKTGKQVIIPLTKGMRALLVSIWPKGGKGWFWPAEAQRYEKVGASPFSQEFYDMLAAAGMVSARDTKKKSTDKGRDAKRVSEKLGFHNLRHTFVTHLKIGGAMDSVAKELAGHSSSAVSAVYTHLPHETLSKAINQLPEFVK